MTEKIKNIKGLLEEIAEENGYVNSTIDVTPVSSGGANYSSILFVGTISALQKEDIKLFIKFASTSEEFRNSADAMASIYIKERLFYTELTVAFKELYDKYNVPEKDRLRFPKFYGYRANELEETLVLENLAEKGFESFDRFKTFDLGYALKAIEQLAKFHALGLACKEENLEITEKIKALETKSVFENENIKQLYTDHAHKMGTQVVKEEYRSKLKNFFEENDISRELLQMWSTNYNSGIVHCDFRPSNLMHRFKDGEYEIVPLDYQTYHFGTLARDLVCFIWSGSDSKLREKHYQELLEHYYKELTQALRNLNIDISKVYSRKTFEKELEETKTLGLLVGLIFIPVLTVNPEDAPELDGLDSVIVQPNQLAIDRMNDIVSDYIKWGIV